MIPFADPNLAEATWILIVKSIVIFAVVMAIVPLLTVVERKVLGRFQHRYGPNRVGPVLVVFSGLAALAIIPFGNVQAGFGLYGLDVPIGVLYFFAFSGFAFYGLLLGGWASGSKYSFLGAMRSAAQLISYEISMGLALLGAVMMAGSLSLVSIVEAQHGIWYVVPQLVGFLVFMVAGFAEANRAPFDLPEADAELVQGYM